MRNDVRKQPKSNQVLRGPRGMIPRGEFRRCLCKTHQFGNTKNAELWTSEYFVAAYKPGFGTGLRR